LNEEEESKYLAAGKIAGRVKKESRQWVRPGETLFELSERIEEIIRELGGLPAFPCNIGVNEIAAHFTPPPGFTGRIPPDGLVKIDFGVHIDGCIVDTAFTIPLSSRDREIVEVAESSLAKASEVLKPGVKINQVGGAIEGFVKSKGYKVIRNLTGHQIDRFNLHTGLSIPNLKTFSTDKFRKDMVVAIEPFVTFADGAGEVSETNNIYIYRFKHFPVDYKGEFNNLVRKIQGSFRTLPFCERWVLSRFGEVEKASLEKMLKDASKHLIFYPVLVERNRRKVAQAEDTFLILEDSVINLTSGKD